MVTGAKTCNKCSNICLLLYYVVHRNFQLDTMFSNKLVNFEYKCGQILCMYKPIFLIPCNTHNDINYVRMACLINLLY